MRQTNKTVGRFLTTTLLVFMFCIGAGTNNTDRWTQGGREEFLKGDPKSASINSEGGIMLPPVATKLFDSPQQFIWDIAVSNLGQLYVAGGNDGIVYDGNGNPAHDDPKPEIHALAFGPDGRLYFGTSPGGAVFRMGQDGRAEEFYKPSPDGSGRPERYIWDLAFDNAGNLYIATGLEGRLYSVDQSGSGKVIFDSDEGNITCVAVDKRGRVIFGSDPNGHIFQLDASGKVFVLFDSPLKEINNVAVDNEGIIYATGVAENAVKKQEEQKKKDNETVKTPAKKSTTGSVTVSNSSDGTSSNGESSALYRILPDGTVESIWSSKELVAYSLSLDRAGRAIFGTGQKGLLISVDREGIETVLRRLDGMQVTALHSVRGELYAGVSNLGRVYKLSQRFANKGEFISQVKDTGTVSTFGTVRWRADLPAGTSLGLMTRTGNTKNPDNTWSDWSEAYSDPKGSPISSPPARFIQWKAELSTTEPSASPLLKSVSIYYLQNNLKPRVKKAEILPSGITFKSGMEDPDDAEIPAQTKSELKAHNITVSGAPAPGRPIFRRPMRTVKWSASDANGDEIIYNVLYRKITGNGWSPLAKGLKDSYYSFDTRMLADGMYVVRIEAHDSPSNTPERALVGWLDTQPFEVDNTPPRVDGLMATASGREVTVTFLAIDDSCAIRDIRLKIDAGEWQVLLPEDGIADSLREQVEVRLKNVLPGDHIVSVQVRDELYNSGAGSVAFSIR